MNASCPTCGESIPREDMPRPKALPITIPDPDEEEDDDPDSTPLEP